MPPAVRTCVLTREEHPREELLRLVASPDGAVVIDYRARLPGRGVWIRPDAEALSRLPKKRAFIERQLRARLDVEAFVPQLRSLVERAVRDGLTQAAASGSLVGGMDRLTSALRAEEVVLVAKTNDVSPRTERTLLDAAGEVPIIGIPMSRDELGSLVGRAPLAAVGVPASPVTGHLRRQLRRLSSLG
jgi:predicted RNA-binding protein YlxR (DUF448 family)